MHGITKPLGFRHKITQLLLELNNISGKFYISTRHAANYWPCFDWCDGVAWLAGEMVDCAQLCQRLPAAPGIYRCGVWCPLWKPRHITLQFPARIKMWLSDGNSAGFVSTRNYQCSCACGHINNVKKSALHK